MLTHSEISAAQGHPQRNTGVFLITLHGLYRVLILREKGLSAHLAERMQQAVLLKATNILPLGETASQRRRQAKQLFLLIALPDSG